MGAFYELSQIVKGGLVKQAKKHHYSESNICILEGDLERLKTEFQDVYNNILSCRHNRDNRTPLEYAQDLVASWIFEDVLIEVLKSFGIDIHHAGADKNREILASSKVSASSDCIINVNEKSIPLEIMTDYTGYWMRNKKIDLRDDKYLKLKNSKSLFLGISTKDKLFILLNFNSTLDAVYHDYYRAYGGKPAYSIHINENDLKQFTSYNLVDNINKMIL